MSQFSSLGNLGSPFRGVLPRSLAPTLLLLRDLADAGKLAAISEGFRVRRKAGGFIGLDAVVFPLAFFASGWKLGGARGFSDFYRPFSTALAATVGRTRWMTQASLSRLLDVVSVADVEWLCRAFPSTAAIGSATFIVHPAGTRGCPDLPPAEAEEAEVAPLCP